MDMDKEAVWREGAAKAELQERNLSKAAVPGLLQQQLWPCWDNANGHDEPTGSHVWAG